MGKFFRSAGGRSGLVDAGGLPPSPKTGGAIRPGVEAPAGGATPLAPRIRAALWGCLVGILIGLALSELWPS